MNKININLISITLLMFTIYTNEAKAKCYENLPETSPDNNYIVNGDGTVTDINAKLMWMQCSVGQQFEIDNCTGTANSFTLEDSLEYSKNIEAFGYDDWNLPSIRELYTIVELSCYSPSININIFPNTPNKGYWTSTTTGYVAGEYGYLISFSAASIDNRNSKNEYYIRLVRSIN